MLVYENAIWRFPGLFVLACGFPAHAAEIILLPSETLEGDESEEQDTDEEIEPRDEGLASLPPECANIRSETDDLEEPAS